MWLHWQWLWQWSGYFNTSSAPGAKVFGTDINEEAGQNTANFIREEGNDFTFYKVNMSNENEVKEFFKEIEKKHQKIDILVNVVGQSEP